jgi:hypothetical protein
MDAASSTTLLRISLTWSHIEFHESTSLFPGQDPPSPGGPGV